MSAAPAAVELLVEHASLLLFPEDLGGQGQVLRDGAIAVADGKFVAVGPTRDIASSHRGRARHDAGGRLVTAGFVDSHTHLVFAGDRSEEFMRRCRGESYEAIAAAGGGIRASVRATRAASEEELFALALPRVERMVAAGSTTIEIKSGYGLDLETELRMLRVNRRLADATPARIISTFCGAHEVPDEFRNDRGGYLDLLCEEVIPRVAAEGLASYCDVFCEAGVFSPEESIRVLETGKKHGLAPKIHADELTASGGAEVAAAVSAASADHLMMLTETGLGALRLAQVVPTLLPGTTFYLGKKRFAPARQLLDAGLPVALATDRNPGSCTIESMLFVCGLACLCMKMSPMEALRGATANGARALRLEQTVGRIAPGLAADFVIWGANDPAEIIYEFANCTPREVYVSGIHHEVGRPSAGAASRKKHS